MNSPRSPFLMSPGDTALLVIDVQTKLLPLIVDQKRVLWNISRLLEAAKGMGVHIAATEQYPEALGSTVDELKPHIQGALAKIAFSCAEVEPLVADLEARLLPKLLLVGLETHICVQQTALDMLARGYDVYLAADAMSARGRVDHRIALDRVAAAGGVITTTESILFEWCQIAQGPAFEQLKPLVRQSPPDEQ
ncbi:MAG: isochorismatase family protein [Pirellulales bacterium]|nr:isochorismatase family protein [Pirellulales bacterium]